MKEWKETDWSKQVKDEDRTKMNENQLNNALVVISNMVARATTKWTLEESKLFLCAVSRIQTRDKDNWVMLRKKDVAELLDVDSKNINKLREMFKRMVMKSYLQFDGDPLGKDKDIEILDGVLMTHLKTTRKDIYIKFSEEYLPLLDQLSSHFTEFYLRNVTSFTRMASYNLYVFLSSWYDPEYLVQDKQIKKSEIHKVFHLKKSDYWRDWGTDKEKFDWATFEKRVINPAIEEINQLAREHKCDLYIDSCEKVKKTPRVVLGYDIHYSFLDEQGFRKIAGC